MASLTPLTGEGRGWLADFRREIDDLAHRFFGNGPTQEGRLAGLAAWSPSVDVEETDKEILVKADLPGIKPEEVEVTVSGGSLVVRGERKEEREDKQRNYHTVERFAGQFYRSIPLPPGTDPEKVTATSSDGVVTVTIPKSPLSQPMKVAVQAAK